MNAGKTVLAQIMDFVSRYEFNKCVDKYNGNYKVKTFSCWEQLIVMSFAQLTYRDSLRDIEACLQAISNKLYHCGVKSKVAKSTLADANENRDWRIYADFAQKLIIEARGLYKDDNDFNIEIDEIAYALDSSVIVQGTMENRIILILSLPSCPLIRNSLPLSTDLDDR